MKTLFQEGKNVRKQSAAPDFHYYCTVVKPELKQLDGKLYKDMIIESGEERLDLIGEPFGIYERRNAAGQT